MKSYLFAILCFAFTNENVYCQKDPASSIESPDGKIKLTVSIHDTLRWSATFNGVNIVDRAQLALKLKNGTSIGVSPKVKSFDKKRYSEEIQTFNYKKSKVTNDYQELTVQLSDKTKILFRACNDGVAYRFILSRKDSVVIEDELMAFALNESDSVYVPYVNDPRHGDRYTCSFENEYQHLNMGSVKKDTLSFLPILVDRQNIKIVVTEADLENYPGMFLRSTGKGFEGEFAPYPLAEGKKGRNNRQAFVLKRADYIAKVSGSHQFPWRVFIVADGDKKLLDNDMVYKLASPSRIKDLSWIKPGKVAWDWWNNWNISGVNFKAGINTETYKYYIDFASRYGLEYILLDEGWAKDNDLMQVVPEIDLQEIVNHAERRGVKVWLWAGWLPLEQKMDDAIDKYSRIGVVGFKVDFMDRDDQRMVRFYYDLARKCAERKMMLDLHGAYKPTGLQRTYPNILNFEGVRGLENVKWSNPDFPKYDCTAPYIRMIAGPMDYTPGAMMNETRANFRSVYASPMSQGTRCHQLALYVVFESPLVMLADNPTNYLNNDECTKFIAGIPTVFDETLAIDGRIGEYAIVARRKSDTWYIGGITNWNKRDLDISLSFLPAGKYQVEIFQDGVNADRRATDYSRSVREVVASDNIHVMMESGGGFAMKISPLQK